ncbi:MAG: hypothetical protein ACI4U0_05605 [Candidatus Aphodocola sp.]
MIKIKFNKSINGFQNELEIKRELDNKTIKELNPMYRSFIEDLFSNINDSDLINCIIDDSNKKHDIIISIKNEKRYISIKKGIKNSVHVEGISSFIHFLIQNHVKRNVVIEYLKYHYADGSTNGTGINRLSAEEYKKENQEKIDMINAEINNKDLLIKVIDRFILKGNISDKSIDAILFGVNDDFIWIKKEDIIKVILSKKDLYSSAVHFGPLTIQPLDRCLNYNPKYDKRRFCVQVKWYNLADDIIEFMNNRYMVKSGYTDEPHHP